MIQAEAFVDAARERGFLLYAGVPCSYLTALIDHVIDAEGLRYVGVANEGEAVAIAAGAELGGTRGVALLQNSGLGNAVSPLASLASTFRIPLLLIPTLRGEPGGPPDEPQHRLMGAITTRMLELLEIPWELFPRDEESIAPALERVVGHMARAGTPYALVMQKGAVATAPRARARAARPSALSRPAIPAVLPAEPVATRAEMLRAVQRHARPEDVVLATTGYTGRELCALEDRPGQLYMVGSMGCVSSLALGLALARPDRRIIVLDGDGAALMRLGALAAVGRERPPNLVHLLLDNGVHESTGSQPSLAPSTDLAAIAAACGYPRVERIALPAALGAFLDASGGELAFAHVPIRPGVETELSRPDVAPPDVARRLRAHLAQGVP